MMLNDRGVIVMVWCFIFFLLLFIIFFSVRRWGVVLLLLLLILLMLMMAQHLVLLILLDSICLVISKHSLSTVLLFLLWHYELICGVAPCSPFDFRWMIDLAPSVHIFLIRSSPVPSSTPPRGYVIFPLIKCRVLFLEYMQECLRRLEYLHERLLGLLYRPVELLLRLVLLDECLRQHRQSLRQLRYLRLYRVLLLLVLDDLLVQVVSSRADIVYVTSQLWVVALQSWALSERLLLLSCVLKFSVRIHIFLIQIINS